MLIISLLLSTTAFAIEKLDYVTYFGTTAEIYMVAWSPGEGAEKHEIRLYNHERKTHINLGVTVDCEYTIRLPKSGHYTVEVRSLVQTSPTEWSASEWAVSTDPKYATVDGKPGAWWIYGCVAPAGPIELYF